MNERYGWLTGSGCCGSSLVQELLSRHRDVAFLSNVEDLVHGSPWWGRWNSALYRRTPQALTLKGRARMAPSEGYRVLAEHVSPLVSFPTGPMTAGTCDPWLVARFQRFFVGRATVQGKPLFLHKFTGHSRTGLTEMAFPGSSYVHVVRDGRAVAASLVRQSWWTAAGGVAASWLGLLPAQDLESWHRTGRSPAVLAALVWQATMLEHEADSTAAGGRWLDLRYEDLLADPLPMVDKTIQHLGLETDPGLEEMVEGYHLDASRTRAYERELSPRTREVIEDLVGDTLGRYGYR